MTMLRWPFVGSEAIAGGAVRKHELRARYCAVFPDVYVPSGELVTIEHRARAAWLWSHRQGVLAGSTASALHGAKWVDRDAPIELVWTNARPPEGLRTYDVKLACDEFVQFGDMAVTSVVRTAFDLGRRGKLGEAVARLDALGHATGLRPQDVLDLARRHRGARGLRQLQAALDLYDPGSASPKETWLRLLLIGDGFPRPRTQIPVRSRDGRRRYYLDMGWEDQMLAVEYDGEQHRLDDLQYTSDLRRSEDIRDAGWRLIRVVKRHEARDVLLRVRRAWYARLRGDREIS